MSSTGERGQIPSATCSTVQGRAERIIDLTTEHLGVDRDRLLSRCRDLETAEARQLLCYVLCRAGYTAAAIARLLDRNHSTVLHAIRRVEGNTAQLDEGRYLTRMILPPIGEDETGRSPGDIPLRAVSQSLLRSLLGRAPLRDVRAVRAYVCGTLLGRKRVSSCQAAWGLCVLVARPCIRTCVEEVLHTCGLPAYCGLIDMHVQRAGVQ